MLPRRKRRVRLHLARNEPSIEGIFVGFWAGHYMVATPEVLTASHGDVHRETVEGRYIRVPKPQVLFVEDLL